MLCPLERHPGFGFKMPSDRETAAISKLLQRLRALTGNKHAPYFCLGSPVSGWILYLCPSDSAKHSSQRDACNWGVSRPYLSLDKLSG